MSETFTLPDEIARKVRPVEAELVRIIEYGMSELNSRNETEFGGIASLLEKLADLPGPEEVMALRPSAALQSRMTELLARNRASGGLTSQEKKDLGQLQYLEHIVRMAKGKALLRLQGKKAS